MTAADRERTAAKFGATPPPPDEHAEREPDDRHLPAAGSRRDRIASTLKLTVSHHHQLRQRCYDMAIALDRNEVSRQDILEALVSRFLTDELLQRKIEADLRGPQ